MSLRVRGVVPVVRESLLPDSQVTEPSVFFLMYLYSTEVLEGSWTVASQTG